MASERRSAAVTLVRTGLRTSQLSRMAVRRARRRAVQPVPFRTVASGAGPLHQAAAAYDRAARGLRRRLPVPTGPARRTRRAAGALRSMEFVRRADTRQLLQLVEQLSRLSMTLAVLREQQGRAAQAAAARRAAELLTAEQTRRNAAAHASVHRLTVTPQTAQATGSSPTRGHLIQAAFGWPGRPAGPAGPTPATRPGRTR